MEHELWSAVCNEDIEAIKKYYENGGKVNVRHNAFGADHSLIMGALRNKQYKTAELLKSYGETVTDEEKEEYKILIAEEKI